MAIKKWRELDRCGPRTTNLTAAVAFAQMAAKLDSNAALDGGLWAVWVPRMLLCCVETEPTLPWPPSIEHWAVAALGEG